jgi:hypothetical protein
LSKYDVITPFKDKETKKSYGVGDQYETKDDNRADFLQQEGFLGEMVEASEPEVSQEAPEAPEEPKKKKKSKSSKESQGSDE